MTALERWKCRRAMVAYCQHGIANEGTIHYAPIRPISFDALDAPPPDLTTDCSGFAIRGAKKSGAPDPSGYGFNGQGNSFSIARGRRWIPRLRDVHRGDYAVFGVWHPDGTAIKTTHVAVVLARAKRPWKRNPSTTILCSHGTERGPFAISAANEITYHPGEEIRYFSLIHGKEE